MKNTHVIIDRDLQVIIVEIKQFLTYGNLLEGIPNLRHNKIIIERTISEAKELFHLQKVHLIEPVLTPIEYQGRYPFGKTESLPRITCLAELKCSLAFKNKDMDFSGLGLVWFQDDYAFPIEKNINDTIKKIPYRKICEEFSYDDM